MQFTHSKRRLHGINPFLLILLWKVLDQLLSLNLLAYDLGQPEQPSSRLKKIPIGINVMTGT